jgi:GTP-binding protein
MAVEVCDASIEISAVWQSQFPVNGLPEIVFAGKSNVGKSSLINAMANRNSLARSSKQPGKTRTINFFNIEYLNDETRGKLFFVDLPGYGYAKVSKSESEKWGAMIEGYLKNRPQLKIIFLLLDVRHEPGAHDKMLFEWCRHYSLPMIPVATKIDKIKRSQRQKYLADLRKTLLLDKPPFAFSSETREGRDALWSAILDKIDRV